MEEEAPIRVERDGEVVREVRVLHCRELLEPVPTFSRIGWQPAGNESSGTGAVDKSSRAAAGP